MRFVNDDISKFTQADLSAVYTVFMLTINFIIISFISKTKFSVILLLADLHSFCSLPSTNFKTDNTTINVLSIFFLPFCVFSFYSTGMICNI